MRHLARGFGALFFSLAAACGARAVGAQDETPQAQVEAELRESARGAIPRAEAVAGDTAAFLARVQSFGPLDLMVLRAGSAKQASDLRSFFLGIVGGAARIDPAPFANRWHCGPSCATARRDTLVTRLAAVRGLVEQFRAIPNADVVAVWPAGGYRAGRLTYDEGVLREEEPSPGMGFLPWRSHPVASDAAAFAALGASRPVVESLVAGMRETGVVAVARDNAGSIRAVLAGGVGDNEAGLLFLAPRGVSPGHEGARLRDGREYVALDPVAPGVYFYVTT